MPQLPRPERFGAQPHPALCRPVIPLGIFQRFPDFSLSKALLGCVYDTIDHFEPSLGRISLA